MGARLVLASLFRSPAITKKITDEFPLSPSDYEVAAKIIAWEVILLHPPPSKVIPAPIYQAHGRKSLISRTGPVQEINRSCNLAIYIYIYIYTLRVLSGVE